MKYVIGLEYGSEENLPRETFSAITRTKTPPLKYQTTQADPPFQKLRDRHDRRLPSRPPQYEYYAA